MLKLKKLLIALLFVIIAAIFFYWPTINTSIYTATGFSAKNICSGHFISHFPPQQIKDEALIPINDMFSYVNHYIDKKDKHVTTDVFGWFKRKAIYRDGIGCTLLAINQNKLERKVYPLAQLREASKQPFDQNSSLSQEQKSAIAKSVKSAFTDDPFRNTKAVVVLHKGKLLAEKYADGVTVHTPLLSWSMAKSVTALLVGILVKDKNLDIYAGGLLTEWNAKPAHQKISLDHLLRMSSGLEFNETYGIGSDAAKMLSIESSASQYAINKNLIYPVDSHWSYSSGSSNIISEIIKSEVSKNADDSFQYYYEFAQQRLFRRLGIESAVIESDAEGTFIGSSYMYMTARDWAKLGQLCLQKGVWENVEILPSHWIDYVTTVTKTNNANSYGAHFWLNKKPSSSEEKQRWPSLPEDLYLMSGYQGQTVAVIPSRELVVVKLGFTPPGVERGTEKLIYDILQQLKI